MRKKKIGEEGERDERKGKEGERTKVKERKGGLEERRR